MDSIAMSSGRAVNLARKDLPTYAFDRIDKRVFRGLGGNIEVFPKEDGCFYLNKKGVPLRVTVFNLMHWTEALKVKRESPSRKGKNRQFNEHAIKEDYRNGMSIFDIMKKHSISQSTVRRYTK